MSKLLGGPDVPGLGGLLATGEVVGAITMMIVEGMRGSAPSNPTDLTHAVSLRSMRERLERR
ncbi:MAG: hypothetical protein HXY24_10905 [Rubrivivax sp.]|nr:hypothetical protein [Rubrivivax sp.]